MKRHLAILLLLLFFSGTLPAQEEKPFKKWSIQLGWGQLLFSESRIDGDQAYLGENRANLFYANADYFLTQRWALTGGIYWEQDGLMTDFSSGIGLRKYNQFGVQTGIKFYFFPKRWVIQPHIGGLVITNFSNLQHNRGQFYAQHIEGYPGNSGIMKYDIHCPFFSLAPHVGVDIHLLSTLSVTLDYDYRFGLWGRNSSHLNITQGSIGGTHFFDERNNHRGGFSIGLKMDFPTHAPSKKSVNNLLTLIQYWLLIK